MKKKKSGPRGWGRSTVCFLSQSIIFGVLFGNVFCLVYFWRKKTSVCQLGCLQLKVTEKYKRPIFFSNKKCKLGMVPVIQALRRLRQEDLEL
jgi:hypothetical protein